MKWLYIFRLYTFLLAFAEDPEVLARKLPKSIGALADGYKLELLWFTEEPFVLV